MVNKYRFKVLNSDTDVEGFGTTEAEGRQDAEACLAMGYPPECELGELVHTVKMELTPIKTDFGPDGPQPGTYAYTAFLMAQLYPEEDWDAWKDEMKDRM